MCANSEKCPQEERACYLFSFFFPTDWKVDIMTGAPTIILDHKVILGMWKIFMVEVS